MLADALNGVLSRQVTAGQRLDEALEGVPEPVRAAVGRLVPALAASDDPQAFCVAGYLRVAGGCSYLLFPATSCPSLAGRPVPGQGLRGPPGHAVTPRRR